MAEAEKIQGLTAELDALVFERSAEQEEFTTSLRPVNHLLSGGDPGGVSIPKKVVDQLVKVLTAQYAEFVGFLALVDGQIKKNDDFWLAFRSSWLTRRRW